MLLMPYGVIQEITGECISKERLILCLYYRGPYKGRIIVPWETESKAKDKRPWLRDPKILEKNLVTVDNSRVYQKNLNTAFPCLILRIKEKRRKEWTDMRSK